MKSKRNYIGYLIAIPVLAMALASGCGDNGSPSDPGDGGNGLQPQWSGQNGIEQYLIARCASCHTSQGTGDFYVTPYSRLITRVVPEDPDNSLLIQMLEGTVVGRPRMPATGLFLPQADINIIRQWIAAGAEEN